MKDFLDQELSEGDEVIFIEGGYRNFKIGTVDKINEKKVTIKYDTKSILCSRTVRFPSEVIKKI